MAVSHSPLPEQAGDLDSELQKCFPATSLSFEGVTLFNQVLSSNTGCSGSKSPTWGAAHLGSRPW